ncbi:TPA: amino acid transporter [Clostridium botulinum]|nr:amino acid transporter [Clostridium botulinum]
MNKYQKKIAKRAKLIKKQTGFPWSACKGIAKYRALYDFIRICG